ncbi:MAG: fluoride efflux transporter CrcB [Cyanobacteria bacterium P01_D01_bin.36]
MTALLEFATVAPHFIPEVLQNPSIRNPIAVSLGAIGGALSRYYLSILLAQRFGAAFPYATVTVNLTGSFAMGFFTALVLERALILSPELRLLIAVGFLGSYTTFSTFELDTLNLLRDAGLNTAAFYWLGSSALGSLSLFLGVVTARLIN